MRLNKKFLRIITALVGVALGCSLIILVDNIIISFGGNSLHIVLLDWAIVLMYVLAGLLFAIIFYIFSPKMINSFVQYLKVTEDTLSRMPVMDILFVALGLALGLFVAFLLSTMLGSIPLPWLVTPLSIGLYVLGGYLGISVTIKRRAEFDAPAWLKDISKKGGSASGARPKVLDTSVIIDGRIFDICQTGILEGVLVVPGFVLKELRHIADSADALKRGRGRRGLDILGRMQKELSQYVRIDERDYDDISEVDLKLLRLTQEIKGVVVTNDYNLNKVASVQDVPVFNINDLANAIKPVVLPGEEMNIAMIKEGKENGQGVGYLDDGTMIVVEGGKRVIGEQVDVQVTSVLQTSAGRMIFAKVI